MKFAFLIILLAFADLSAQSGRVKPSETPEARPTPQHPGNYSPTNERSRVVVAGKQPTPTPTPRSTDDEEDVIKVESTLVPIPVSVIDQNGRALRDLCLSDIELFIDGKLVEIGEMTRSDSPVRLAMLFDNSGSVLAARKFEIDAAARFFERVLRPDKDLGSLFSVATVTRLEQPLTANRDILASAIRAFPPPEGATALMDGIQLAANYLKDIAGRRVIVIVSDGDDTKTDTTFERALRTAQLANCQIFIVQTTGFENFIRTGSRSGNANIRSLAAERRMQSFANQTGGAVFMPIDQRELDMAFDQISADLSEQYVLSYYPDDDKGKTGEFRQIEVRVKNRTGLTIRARKGYYVSMR
ncbi:MAG: VWA domain-containing protein [Acidobacteria bacterium]|nr:VWA domain-containing protein [Acidobacteriota bacterium]